MKALFDKLLSLILLVLLFLPLFFLIIIAKIYNGGTGIFKQERLGLKGKIFTIYKLQTFCLKTNTINKVGFFLRKYKLDETPQLINILKGDMSFVGPRPELPEYLDKLKGEFNKILELKPGLTSPATLKYINEEQVLLKNDNPKFYNDSVIYPDKLRLNLNYYYKQSFLGDIKIIIKTVIKIIFRK